MTSAYNISKYSYARRRKVGAVIAKHGRILSLGYNGTPAGFDNECEEMVCKGTNFQFNEKDCLNQDCKTCKNKKEVTKDIVIHAEENALAKLAKSTESSDGADLYVTCAPCVRCARLIVQCGIKTVYYSEAYHSTDGIELLKKAGLNVVYLNINTK